ncbi:hypothetical protein [Mycolicibacterium sp. NCC-Tsukiji]|uniref:hypothetical protein n=1 Tax=Mycolicibacterium sp. NCC-Tsukiji TaxID=2185272 RepID=UPI00107FA36F|nr:hypothetical protein [Mycolicibacterium sp. NCC-Tsukiji]
MSAAHARKSTANPQKMTIALLASATAVTASVVVANPQTKTVATQLPEITRQVKLTAGADPISLIEGLLALPTSVAQQLLGNGQWINNLAHLAAQPLVAADNALYGLDAAAAPVIMNAVTTLLSPIASTPVAPALEAALQEYFNNAAFPPTAFSGGGLPGFNFYDLALASLYDFGAPATALFPAAVTLLEKLGIPLPLPGNLTPNGATNAPLSPTVTSAAATPQDLIGGLGNVVSSAVSMVANDVAYAVNLPLAVTVPVVVPLVAGLPYTLAPQALLGLLTTNLPNALRFGLATTVNEIVSQAGQFVSSLGGLVAGAAAPSAATSVPKLQTNFIKLGTSPTALSAPTSVAGAKPDKTGPEKKLGKTGSDHAGADKSGSDKASSDKTGSDTGGKHRKPAASGQAGGGSRPDAATGKAGESKSGKDSHGGDGPKHSSDTSGQKGHGTGDGQGGTGSRGGSGGHRGGK